MMEEESSANNGNDIINDIANNTGNNDIANNTGSNKIFIYKGNEEEEEVPMDIQHLIIHNSVLDIPDRTFLGRTMLVSVQFYDADNAADNNNADNADDNNADDNNADNVDNNNINNKNSRRAKLRSIGAYAFGDCTSLHSLSIPKNVSIGEYAFAGCTSLSHVEFVTVNNNDNDEEGKGEEEGDEEDEMEIGTMAFYRCMALSNINFPGVATTTADADANNDYYYDASPGSDSNKGSNNNKSSKSNNNNFTLETANIIGSSKDLTIWKRSYQRNRMLLLVVSSILIVVVILGVVIGVGTSSPPGDSGGGNGGVASGGDGSIVDNSPTTGDESTTSTTTTTTTEEEIEYCILVNVTLDKYPTDTSWKIEDTSNKLTIATSSPYLESMAYSTVDEQEVCFSSSSGGKQEYSFGIFDEYGDGLCCSWGSGRYTVSTMNGLIIASGGEFEYEERTTFVIPFIDSNGQQQQPQSPIPPPATTGGSTSTTATTPPPVSLSSTCITIEISITLDKYPLDTTWNIINSSSGEMVVNSSPYDEFLAGTTQIDTICLLNGEYTFTIFDVFEDGMCCKWGDGGYILRYLSSKKEIISGGEWVGASETRSFSISNEDEGGQQAGEEAVQQQPMSPPAVTPPPTAPPTKEPTPRPTPKPSTLPPTPNPTTSAPTPPPTATTPTCTTIDVSITLDKYPLDTSWEIIDSTTGNILATSPPYDETLAESTQVTSICLPAGLYSFVIYDVYEDGICCAWGQGSYTLLLSSGESILVTGGEWIGPSETKMFTISSERQA